jgi:creatinine amidohydrolase/Fe(II)-dependent formamide hydrolase-like protein
VGGQQARAAGGVQGLRLLLLACLWPALAWAQSLYIEDLTTAEVKAAIAGGRTTAIYYAGSTEQNGAHLALGKHNFIARYVAGRIAEELGDALVYPTMPFAPTGDHMKYPGTVNVSGQTFAAVARDVAKSALASGFSTVVLMGDHGGGQAELRAVARELGPRVLYAGDAYYKSTGEHAGVEDTSELLFVDREQRWVRRERIPPGASAELGRKLIEAKVRNAVAQIRLLRGR